MEYDRSEKSFRPGRAASPSVAATALAIESGLGGFKLSLQSSSARGGDGEVQREGLEKQAVCDLGQMMYESGQEARLVCGPIQER